MHVLDVAGGWKRRCECITLASLNEANMCTRVIYC